MSDAVPVIVWFRRDLRLAYNPALVAAAAGGRPVICLFVLDAQAEAIGAAARWHLGQGLAALAATLQRQGERLILRRGEALAVLRAAVGETGAREGHWGRLYTPEEMARDRAVKAALRADGVKPRAATPGHCWRTLGGGDGFRRGLSRVRGFLARHRGAGSGAAAGPAAKACDTRALACQRAACGLGLFWSTRRQVMPRRATFRPAPAPQTCRSIWPWAKSGFGGTGTGAAGAAYGGAAGVGQFLHDLVWREFAAHLIYHFPDLASRSWHPGWEGFPWRGDNDDAEAWRRGQTGEPMVDAAMREIQATGACTTGRG